MLARAECASRCAYQDRGGLAARGGAARPDVSIQTGEYDNARAGLARAGRNQRRRCAKALQSSLRRSWLTHADLSDGCGSGSKLPACFSAVRPVDVPRDVRGATPMALAVGRHAGELARAYADGVTIAQQALALAPAEATTRSIDVKLARARIHAGGRSIIEACEAEGGYRANARAAVTFATQRHGGAPLFSARALGVITDFIAAQSAREALLTN